MADRFNGMTAVVTGASSGIGLATAEKLVEEGAAVVRFARQERKSIAGARYVQGDISREGDIERLFTEVEAEFGHVDFLVNCAGTVDPVHVEKSTQRQWDEVFAVNTRGTFLTCRRVLRSMIPRRSGSIVNVASISGILGYQKFPGFASYCASKAAVIAFTEVLASEVREHGIRVNAISPGSVDTEMLQRAAPGAVPDMTTREVADGILYLLSSESRPVHGQNIHFFSV